jgi:hypothetical protein
MFIGGSSNANPAIVIDTPSVSFRSIAGTTTPFVTNTATPTVTISAPVVGTMGGWLTWPAITHSASTGTVTFTTMTDDQYIQVGPMVYLKSCVLVNVGSVTTDIILTLLVAAVGAIQCVSGSCTQASNLAAVPCRCFATTTHMLWRNASAGWPTGATYLVASGCYRSA